MEFIKNLAKVVLVKSIIYSIALFYGWVTIISVLYKWFRKGNDFWIIKERTLPPLCLQDAKYGRHSYIKLKDLKIHYVENGDRTKPLMLFVHGFPEFWFTWRNQLEYFSKTHWVVALDLRGYGDSDKPSRVSDYRTQLLMQDIVDFIKALNRESCILVGHDWGGAISWNVAAYYPQVVRQLVILNCPHPTAMALKLSTSWKQFLKSWYIFFFQLPFLPELCYPTNDLFVFNRLFGDTVTSEELEGYKYNWARKGAFTAPMNYYRNILDATGILNPIKHPKIKIQTLLIWGEDDIAMEPDLPEMSKPFVEDIQVHLIPGGNHFVHHHKPQQVNQIIEKFIT